MKMIYDEPLIEIRNYSLPPKDVVITASVTNPDPDLEDGDDFEIFG